MPAHPFATWLIVLSVLSGCGRKEPSPRPVASAAPLASASASASASAQAPAPGVRTADAQAVVASWQEAQNRGDFVAYAALYDDAFTGIKRVGEKSFRFDKRGWLADRKAMFQRDVTVTLRDTRVFTGRRSAFAVFTQEWSTPRFADVGQKRLELALVEGQLRIVREELLESKTLAQDSVAAPAPEELALVVQLPQGLGVVLRNGVEGTGKVSSLPSKSELEHRVARDATPAEIQPFRALVGRSMDLYQRGAVACTGRVKSFVGVAGVFGSGDVGPDASPQGKADAIWEFASSTRYLMAVIEPDRPGCEAQWARASDLPKPTIFAARAPAAPESTPALAALQKTSAGRQAQKSYDRYAKELGQPAAGKSWTEHSGQERSTTVFVDATTQTSYAAVELAVGEGCDDFGGYALGFFKITPQGWLDLTGDGDPRHALPLRPLYGIAPHTAVVTRPSQPPLLVGDGVVYAQGAPGYAPVLTVGALRTMCSC